MTFMEVKLISGIVFLYLSTITYSKKNTVFVFRSRQRRKLHTEFDGNNYSQSLATLFPLTIQKYLHSIGFCFLRH